VIRLFLLAVASLVSAPSSPVHGDEPDPYKEPAFKGLFVSGRRDDQAPGKPFVHLSVGGETATDDLFKLFVRYPELRSLSVSGPKVTGSEIKQLVELKNLDRLSLGFTGVTDENLKELTKLKGLKHLSLLNTKITDKGMKVLLDLPDLETLEVAQLQHVSAGAFKDLAALKKLRHIYVGNSSADDETMKAFATLPELRSLTINGTSVTEAGYAHIAKMPKLERLQINYGVTEKELKLIGGIDTLRQLDLFGARVTPEQILAMKNADKLTYLHVSTFPSEIKDEKAAIKKIQDGLPKCKVNSFFRIGFSD